MTNTPTSAPLLEVKHVTCAEDPSNGRAPSMELVEILRGSRTHAVVLKCPACHTAVVLHTNDPRLCDQLGAWIKRTKPSK